jgi:hypothetical protein
MIDNDLDDLSKTRHILDKMQMSVRNNREFEFYSNLIDLLDEL